MPRQIRSIVETAHVDQYIVLSAGGLTIKTVLAHQQLLQLQPGNAQPVQQQLTQV